MEDYYKLLDVDYDSSIEVLNNAYKNKLNEYKSLPFLTDNDKQNIKNIKKAYHIFNNTKYKKIYDRYIQNKFSNDGRSSKKNLQNQTYLSDRIFSFQSNNNYNLNDNELLRPKNVGLISDDNQDFIKPTDSGDFQPYNFDTENQNF
jgi:DnaJ-class molecular chaperone